MVHGTLQARTLEWVAFPFSRGSSQPRAWTQVSHIAGGVFASWATSFSQGISLNRGMMACRSKGRSETRPNGRVRWAKSRTFLSSSRAMTIFWAVSCELCVDAETPQVEEANCMKMTNREMTVRAERAALRVAPPLACTPWKSPFKALPTVSGELAFEQESTLPPAASLQSKADFPSHQPCLSSIGFWATSSQLPHSVTK